jgi:hypothetical protein
LKDRLSEDVHYKVVDERTWNFLFEIYGGQDLPRLSIAVPTTSGKDDYIVEINLRKFNIVTFPNIRYFEGITNPKLIFISKNATVQELHSIILHELKADVHGVSQLKILTRLWTLSGSDNLQDAKDILQEANGDISKMPLPIQARVLGPE